ncbi:phosphorylase family protein [Sphingomonas mali]|uniref:phosphorylase family protein n=1 Tax=Sphingomonas mali TaxID=40682 RepID=UPI00082FBD60|nr:phosphorylase [Sphingomonas mali]
MTLIIACGLKREARIFDRPGRDVFVVIGGGQAAALDRDLDDEAEMFPGIILSCGIAGALAPSLRPGDVVIDGDAVVAERLAEAVPHAHRGGIVGNDAIVATAREKRLLSERTGALAVDMESHVAARVALRKGLPFAALRIISDRAEDDLPPAALVGMRPDGGMALGAVLASLSRAPRQLPPLIRTGRQADQAFRGLETAFEAIIRAGIDRLALPVR